MRNNLDLTLSGRVFELSYSENALSLDKFFKVAAENGFTSVELRDSQISIDSLSSKIDEVNQLSEKYMLPVALITARKGRLDNADGYEIYKKYLNLAANLNCRQIKISGKDASLIQKAAADAEKFNIKIGTNNHLGTPLATTKGTLEWFEKINHSNFYLHFDPSHLWLNGEVRIEEFIDTMIERISYVIIQDYLEIDAGSHLGTRDVAPVSTGTVGSVGYPRFIEKLRKMNFNGPFSLVYLNNAIKSSGDNRAIADHLHNYLRPNP
jgi:sugar phosphate isomerase/epimerase